MLLLEKEFIVVRPESSYFLRQSESPANQEKVKARNVRRNRLFLRALQQHTADKFRWNLLNDWTEDWDICHRVNRPLDPTTVTRKFTGIIS